MTESLSANHSDVWRVWLEGIGLRFGHVDVQTRDPPKSPSNGEMLGEGIKGEVTNKRRWWEKRTHLLYCGRGCTVFINQSCDPIICKFISNIKSFVLRMMFPADPLLPLYTHFFILIIFADILNKLKICANSCNHFCFSNIAVNTIRIKK